MLCKEILAGRVFQLTFLSEIAFSKTDIDYFIEQLSVLFFYVDFTFALLETCRVISVVSESILEVLPLRQVFP